MLWLFKRQASTDPLVEEGARKIDLTFFRLIGGHPNLSDKYWLSVIYVSFLYSQLWFVTIRSAYLMPVAIEDRQWDLMSERTFQICYLSLYIYAIYNVHQHRDTFDFLLKTIGKDFFTYSTPPSEKQQEIYATDVGNYNKFRKIYRYFVCICVSYMAFVLPLMQVLIHGSLSTESVSGRPYNKYFPLKVYPFNTSTLSGFIPGYLYEGIFICYYGVLLMSMDMTMGSLTIHLTLQMKLLGQSIDEIPERASKMCPKIHKGNFKNEENISLCPNHQECLIQAFFENIKHHHLLMVYLRGLQKLLNGWLLALFIGSGFVICFCGVLLKNVTGGVASFIISSMYLADSLIVVFFYSWLSENLRATNFKFQAALYNLSWPDYGKKFSRSLLIALQFSQRKDIGLKGSSIATFSLETFAEILKTSYSYFNVINATTNN